MLEITKLIVIIGITGCILVFYQSGTTINTLLYPQVELETIEHEFGKPLGINLNHEDSETVIVNTDCGQIVTVTPKHKKYHVFKGIPYASPPVKEKRWQPPKEISSTSGSCEPTTIVNATMFAPSCAQPKSIIEQGPFDEDCLYLNIWAPKKRSKLPVIVYIYGGDLTGGDSFTEGFIPWPLVHFDKAIVVSINYRLGAFGFLSLKSLNSTIHHETITSTNYVGGSNLGLLDCIAALKWIQSNIERFGGDPSSVTISGQSSGGTLVFALDQSPLAKGLFHKGIAMSPSAMLNYTATEASALNMKYFVKNTACAGQEEDAALLNCLYALSTEEIIAAYPPEWDGNIFAIPGEKEYMQTLPLLVIDGHSIVDPFPTFHVQSPKGSNVPLIIGSLPQETAVASHFFDEDSTGEDLKAYLTNVAFHGVLTKQEMEKLYRLYDISNTPASNFEISKVYESISSDLRTRCSVIEYAKHCSNDVYFYSIPFGPEHTLEFGPMVLRHSFHMWDLILISWSPGPAALFKPTLKDLYKAGRLNKFFLDFASGDDLSGMSLFSRSNSDSDYFVNEIGAADTVAKNYLLEKCTFWKEVGLVDSYAWIN